MRVLKAVLGCQKCSLQHPQLWVLGSGSVALLTDGRFSGGSHGFCIGHITPEAGGGPIALVRDGDPIQIDARPEARTIDLLIDEEEWNRRRAEFVPPALRSQYGTLFKYIKNVATASKGCVTDEINSEAEESKYGQYTPPHVPAAASWR